MFVGLFFEGSAGLSKIFMDFWDLAVILLAQFANSDV